MGLFNDLKNHLLNEQHEQAAIAAKRAAAIEEERQLAQAQADRLSPLVVHVLEEFLAAVGWQDHKVSQARVDVHFFKDNWAPTTRTGARSEAVWVVPNPKWSPPDHPSYALVTVCLEPRDSRFTCYVPHGKFGRHPRWGERTPKEESKNLTAESLAATLAKLYRSRDDK